MLWVEPDAPPVAAPVVFPPTVALPPIDDDDVMSGKAVCRRERMKRSRERASAVASHAAATSLETWLLLLLALALALVVVSLW